MVSEASSVPHPSEADRADRLDPLDSAGDVLHLVDELRLDRIHEPPEHLARGLLEDHEDDHRDEEAHARVGDEGSGAASTAARASGAGRTGREQRARVRPRARHGAHVPR